MDRFSTKDSTFCIYYMPRTIEFIRKFPKLVYLLKLNTVSATLFSFSTFFSLSSIMHGFYKFNCMP